jgi:hypothetical protein
LKKIVLFAVSVAILLLIGVYLTLFGGFFHDITYHTTYWVDRSELKQLFSPSEKVSVSKGSCTMDYVRTGFGAPFPFYMKHGSSSCPEVYISFYGIVLNTIVVYVLGRKIFARIE